MRHNFLCLRDLRTAQVGWQYAAYLLCYTLLVASFGLLMFGKLLYRFTSLFILFAAHDMMAYILSTKT